MTNVNGRPIQIRQGSEFAIGNEQLLIGEMALSTDTWKVFVGTSGGNVRVGGGDSSEIGTIVNTHANVIASNNNLGHVKVGRNVYIDTSGILYVNEATTNQLGIVRLNDTVSSYTNTQAGTANSVRIAFEKGVEALNTANNAINIANQAMNNSGSGSGDVKSDGTVAMQNLTVGTRNSYKGIHSVVIGSSNAAHGIHSLAQGRMTFAIGDNSSAFGELTEASAYSSISMGYLNKPSNQNGTSFSIYNNALTIGNGGNGYGSNAFRVTFSGQTYGLSAFNSSGADYAEYFEWLDGNKSNDDRVGFVVTLVGEKIRKANSDDKVLGIISANPSVIGDSHQDDWSERYMKDIWGRKIVEDYIDEKGNNTKRFKQNPKWNPKKEYTPREERKEWDAVGLVGKLLVRDDGVSKVNDYVKVGSIDGEVTYSEIETNIRVMKRINDNIIQVFIK